MNWNVARNKYIGLCLWPLLSSSKTDGLKIVKIICSKYSETQSI